MIYPDYCCLQFLSLYRTFALTFTYIIFSVSHKKVTKRPTEYLAAFADALQLMLNSN